MSEPTATKKVESKNLKEVTATKLKKLFATAESYFVPPQPHRQNKCSNKTYVKKKDVSERKNCREFIE